MTLALTAEHVSGWFSRMDSPPMHFAVGMVCGGAIWLLVCLVRRRWWVYGPLAMTLGGIWAEGPDVPQLAAMYPSIPGARWISNQHLSTKLHGDWANVFFFHGWIDRTETGGYDRGFAIAVALYLAWSVALIWAIRRRNRREEQDAA
jgi:hypothetical protein